jgi:hypothetical protein
MHRAGSHLFSRQDFCQCGALSFRTLILPVSQKPKLHDIHGMMLSFLAECTSDGAAPRSGNAERLGTLNGPAFTSH